MTAHAAGETLRWEGARVIERIGRRLAQRQRTVLHLPLEYHPALSAVLDDRRRIRPRLHICGDAGLLRRIARIPELQPLAALAPPMVAAGGRLRVVSPAPHLVFIVPKRVSGDARVPSAVWDAAMAAEPLLAAAPGVR